MAVNLLPPDARAQAKASILHRSVYLATTLVLVVYLVVVSAVGGWWLFLSTRQTQLKDQIMSLSSQIAQKAAQEVLLRQESSRIGQIDAATKKRINLSDLADRLSASDSSLQIVGWDLLGETQKNNINLTASDSGKVEAYAEGLLKSFETVNIFSLNRSAGSWHGEVVATTIKNP